MLGKSSDSQSWVDEDLSGRGLQVSQQQLQDGGLSLTVLACHANAAILSKRERQKKTLFFKKKNSRW